MSTTQILVDKRDFFEHEKESRALIDELKYLENLENVYDFEHSLLKRDIQSYQLIKKTIEIRNNRDLELEAKCSDLKEKYYLLIDFISDFDMDDIARYNILVKGIQYNKEMEHLSSMLAKYTDIRKKYEEVDLLKILRSKELELEKKQEALKFQKNDYEKICNEMKHFLYEEELKIRTIIVALVLGSEEISNQINEIINLKNESQQLEIAAKKNQSERCQKTNEKEYGHFNIFSTILPKKSSASKIQTKLNLLEANNEFETCESSSKIKKLEEKSMNEVITKDNCKKAVSWAVSLTNSIQLSSLDNETKTSTSEFIDNRKTTADTNNSSINDQICKKSLIDKDIHTEIDKNNEQSFAIPKKKVSYNKVTILENRQIRPPTITTDKFIEIGSLIKTKETKKRSSSSSDDDVISSKHRRNDKLKRKFKSTKNEFILQTPEIEKKVEHAKDKQDKPLTSSTKNPKSYSNEDDSSKYSFGDISHMFQDSGSMVSSSGEDEKKKGRENKNTNELTLEPFHFDTYNSDEVSSVRDDNSFFL